MSFDRKPEITAEDVRASLRLYPAKKDSFWTYLLKTYCVTLEVFLHREMGERYLTTFRVIFAFLSLYVVGHAYTEWEWAHWFDLFGWSWLPISGPSFHSAPAKVFGFPITFPVFAKTDFAGVSTLAVALSVFLAVAEWRMLEIFIANRLGERTHNRSSGESYGIWNPIYLLSHKLNFQVDVVKQGAEPLVCLLLAIVIFGWANAVEAPGVFGRSGVAHERAGFRFLGVWLLTGSIALFTKAYLENRLRKETFLDRVANEIDMEALQSLNRLNSTQTSTVEFPEVEGRQ